MISLLSAQKDAVNAVCRFEWNATAAMFPLGVRANVTTAPITAGDVALIRQYFREGYYPVGTKGAGTPMTISGAMMKAAVIHSAVPLQGTYQGAPIGPTPNNIEGYGRVQLDQVLMRRHP